MPGDYTRLTFNPFEDHLGVLMQQGRVMVDADFNELVDIVDRRFRAETTDIIGRCVVPKQTPEGFRIQIVGSGLTIGRGRLYADGLLAENHGLPPLEFDPVLAESRGTLAMPYDQQPYLPNAATAFPVPTSGGPHLVYVDVWQREITWLEEADLVDKAVGVDTSTRRQTVWQVKVLPRVGAVTCATPDGQIPGWSDIIRPSAGRLTTGAVGVPASTDPCIINPAGGYRGTENRLYRVEIHQPGPLGTATFKWSRDNASIATAVTAINAGRDVLTVSRIGRDAVLRVRPGDWVEVIDDVLELVGQPGHMRKVQLVDDVNQTISLTAALPAGVFDATNPGARHTRVRRWDQQGQVLDAANTVVDDVDVRGGVILVPAAGSLVLEDGVQVTFTTVAAGGAFRTGDYWAFAARTVDASVEQLQAAPPRGIHHHYCRLALVTFPGSVTDCRTLWPPDFGEGSCDCTVCVSAESHNSGALTIQMAIEQVKATGGKVCLGPGLYNLGETPVVIQNAQGIQLQGHGLRTILFYSGPGAAVGVLGSIDVTVSDLAVLAFGRANAGALAMLAQNCLFLRIERCGLVQFGGGDIGGAGLGLGGVLAEVSVRDNVMFGTAGILSLARQVGATTSVAAARSYSLLFGMKIVDNLIVGQRLGISFDGLTLHLGQMRIAGNSVYGGQQAGIADRGFVLAAIIPSSRIDIDGNQLWCSGDGIVVGTDNVRVGNNDIGGLAGARRTTGSGIVIIGGAVRDAVDRCQVIDNRLVRLQGDGIAIRTIVGSAMIKGNIVEAAIGGGIVMSDDSEASVLSIEGNQVLNAGITNQDDTPVAAIRIVRAQQADVTGNVVRSFGVQAVQSPSRIGIEIVAARSVRVSGNDLADIGPPGEFVQIGAGILVRPPFDRVDVGDNSVRRQQQPSTDPDPSAWYAVVILVPVRPPVGGIGTVGTIGGAAGPVGPVVTGPIGTGTIGTIGRVGTVGTVATGARGAVGTSVVGTSALGASALGSRSAVTAANTRIGNAIFVPVSRDTAVISDVIVIGVGRLGVLPPGREIVSVRGNLLEARGRVPAALVSSRGTCVFSDNRCLLTTRDDSVAVAQISGTAVITSANYLERGATGGPAVRMTVPAGAFTILGNIANGEIVVNGAPLPAASPYRPLNVIAP